MRVSGRLAFVLVLVCAMVAGCTSSQYGAVQAGVVTAGKMRVTLGSGWARAPDSEVPEKQTPSQVFSRDGLEYDRLILVASVPDGGTIFRDQAGAGLPTFRADMSATEIANLVAESLRAVLWEGEANVAATSPRAYGYTGIPGFRFELEADIAGSADHRGIGGGFVFEDRLYVNIFLAESPKFFDRHEKAAKAVLDSAVVTVKTIKH